MRRMWVDEVGLMKEAMVVRSCDGTFKLATRHRRYDPVQPGGPREQWLTGAALVSASSLCSK